MTSVKRMDSASTTPAPRASGDDEPWLPKIPGPRQPSGLKPRPAPPRQELTVAMNPKLRDIDWNGHIPTARQAAGSYTRAGLDNAIANQVQDEPRPYDAVVLGFQYDRLQADNAFGSTR